MEWNVVSVEDGFPDEEGEYLLTDGEYVWIDDFCTDINDDGQTVCWFERCDINRVTAWMPLPKPYKKINLR